MGLKFPSDEWAEEYAKQLNASEAYERAAKDWEGDFIFTVEADDTLPETAYLFADFPQPQRRSPLTPGQTHRKGLKG